MHKIKLFFLVIIYFITSIHATNFDDFNTIKNLIVTDDFTEALATIISLTSANPLILEQIDSEGNTLLHYAIEAGSPSIVNALMSMGADPNFKYGKKGDTVALFDALNAIIKSNRPFNLENNDPHSLVLANLIKGAGKWKTVLNRYIQDTLTPLAFAIKNSPKPPAALVLFLLSNKDNKANPMLGFRAESKNPQGDYPLNIAVSNFASKPNWQNNLSDFKNLILNLIKFNANVIIPDSYGRRPIEVLTYSLEDMDEKGDTANSSRLRAALLLLFNNSATDYPEFEEFLSRHPIIKPIYEEYQESSGSNKKPSSGSSKVPIKPLKPKTPPTATTPLSPLRPPVSVSNPPIKLIPLDEALKDLSRDLSSLAKYK